MFPDYIEKIIIKHQSENDEISTINAAIDEIVHELNKINGNIVEKLKLLLNNINTTEAEDSLLQDSKTLRKFISTISMLECDELKFKQTHDNNLECSKELSELSQPPLLFDKKVSLYLVDDDICPFCNVKFTTHRIFYDKIENNQIIHKSINEYKCPVCNRLFILDEEIDDRSFDNTNIVLNKSKYENIPPINIHSIVILKNTLKCSINHKTKDIIAKFPSINKNGELIYTNINASYCFNCDRFTVLKDDFDEIKENILCKVTDETYVYNGSKSTNDVETEQRKSILYNYGYNVQTKRNLSEKQRHIILESVIEAKIMDKRAIVDHLNMMIQRLSVRDNCADAIQKWKDDISFIKQYRQGSMDEVIFNEVIKKYRQS